MKLFLAADDFTGALDAGVQFAKHGLRTQVAVEEIPAELPAGLDVLAVDANTRHKSAEAAYQVIFSLSRKAMELGFPLLMKKTDSAMRGNIGAELTAMLDASGEKQMAFVPAFPQLGRLTIGGVVYLDGVPVQDTAFGQDPSEPVMRSDVAQLIRLQSKVAVRNRVSGDDLPELAAPHIDAYDCASDAQMLEIAQELRAQNRRVLAGCAGLAGALPEAMGWSRPQAALPVLPPRLLAICGSVHPATLAQTEYALSHGFVRLALTREQKQSDGYWSSGAAQAFLEEVQAACRAHSRVVIDTGDMLAAEATLRHRITSAMGSIVKAVYSSGLDVTLLMTGGDTLRGCMQQLPGAQLSPIGEFSHGVVLSELWAGQRRYVFTKAGSFGALTLLDDLANWLERQTQ